MLRHVVLLRWNEGTTTDEVDGILEALAELPARIPSLLGFHVGPDAGIDEGNWNLAITADFDDEAGYATYRDDPRHREIILTMIRPRLAARAAAQFHLGPQPQH